MYKAISTSFDVSLRNNHSAYAERQVIVPRNTPMYGDLVWTVYADNDQNAEGDIWLHVTKYGDMQTNTWIAIVHKGKTYCTLTETQDPSQPDTSKLKLIPAIQATKAGCDKNTYANILLRPVPKKGMKDSPIKLLPQEIIRVQEMLDFVRHKWNWVAGDNHTRYIYMRTKKDVKITSISAYYSGSSINQFNVLDETKNWWKVETIRAGSDWWQMASLPIYLTHQIYTFKGRLPPCGSVTLPVITRTGFGWIEKDQAVA